MGWLKEQFSNAAWTIEKKARDKAKLHLKMELFVAKYPGKVMFPVIPIFGQHKNGKPSDKFVTCYFRTVHPAGTTRFHWYYDLLDAREAADHFKSEGEKVVGPYMLPKGEDDRFV